VSESRGDRPNPTSVGQLRALFREFDFRPRKSLGQTFLTDANIARKIIAAADLHPDDPVLEIGPGAGAMTHLLQDAARRVLAIEIDPTLAAILQEPPSDRLQVLQEDVLQVDWPALLGREGAGRWNVVANLPYAITGPAILKLLEAKEWLARLTIMVQVEVAERLVSPPGSKARGLLGVLVEAGCETHLAFRVPRTCFWPLPQVDSAVVTLEVRRPPLVPPSLEALFRRVVRGAFGTRRKTLANALAHSAEVSVDKAGAEALLEACGVAPERRAETLTVAEFLCVAEHLAAHEEGA